MARPPAFSDTMGYNLTLDGLGLVSVTFTVAASALSAVSIRSFNDSGMTGSNVSALAKIRGGNTVVSSSGESSIPKS